MAQINKVTFPSTNTKATNIPTTATIPATANTTTTDDDAYNRD